jgi:hypothetical protein
VSLELSASRSVGKTGEELALEMADAMMNVFGSVKPTEEDRRDLADHLVMTGLRWVDDRYKVGLAR